MSDTYEKGNLGAQDIDLSRVRAMYEGSLAAGRYRSREDMEAAYQKGLHYIGGNSLGEALQGNSQAPETRPTAVPDNSSAAANQPVAFPGVVGLLERSA